ncbi:MAG: NAD(P)H-dependent oxidoreductase [Gammaproteobacteria bacterium]|nr:NAD(P)H-dependent oxidoreductase [Gammaproteobacteria bacterium]
MASAQSGAQTNNSNSQAIGQYLIEALDQPTITRDLATDPLPPISAEDLIDLHASATPKRESFQAYINLSDTLIEELRSADNLVIESPMYNFSVPVVLKQWIDAVARAGISFRYGENGPEGLLDIKQAYLIITSGGTPIGSGMDFASRYLEHICRFIGVHSIAIIHASGSKRSPEIIFKQAQAQINSLLADTRISA